MEDDYSLGYEDGKMGLQPNIYLNSDEYKLGYEDGYGEFMLKRQAEGHRYVDDEAMLGDPPTGFVFSGEKRTPEPGDFYLTKNGGAKLSVSVRKNSQKRHILLLSSDSSVTVSPLSDVTKMDTWMIQNYVKKLASHGIKVSL